MLIDVSLIKENADGSAVFSFELSEDMKDALLRFGIMKAIEAGIEASKELHPSFEGEPEWTPEDMSYRPGGLPQPAHREGYWCEDLTCSKCYSADFRFKHAPPDRRLQEYEQLAYELAVAKLKEKNK
jgi:hypothetical protein